MLLGGTLKLLRVRELSSKKLNFEFIIIFLFLQKTIGPNRSSVDLDDIKCHQHSEDYDKNSCNMVEPMHIFPPQYFRASNQKTINGKLAL